MSLFVFIQRESPYPSTVVAHVINSSKLSGCVGRWAATGFNINNSAFPLAHAHRYGMYVFCVILTVNGEYCGTVICEVRAEYL